MTEEVFDNSWLGRLWRPSDENSKFDGGQVIIVGGSSLFHGAPILALKAASRLVSMVYFCSHDEDKGAVDLLKSSLGSFIWIPRNEIFDYIDKCDAVLVGPGMMRNRKESDGMVCDELGKETKEITMSLISKFQSKKFVIDGGSLQVLRADELPHGSVITPNKKEFFMLFGEELSSDEVESTKQVVKMARNYGVVIVHKAPVSIVTDGERVIHVKGGNPGLVKGAMGDVMAGLTVGLLAKNEPLLAAASAIYLSKMAADSLDKKVGYMFNADDLADEVPKTYRDLLPLNMRQLN